MHCGVTMSEVSLIPRLSVGEERGKLNIHCLRMHLISRKSWEIGNYYVYPYNNDNIVYTCHQEPG